MSKLPQSPDELLQRLFGIFPDFRASYEGPLYDEPLSYDSVVTAFTSDFGVQFRRSTPVQYREFAALLSDSVAAGGDIAHAFVSCFLQHVREVDVNRVFFPYLPQTVHEYVTP